MSLDKDRLGNAIADRLIARLPSPPNSADETEFRQAMKEFADEIIKEFVNNAVVNVDNVTGVTTGTGVSGPGTGSIS